MKISQAKNKVNIKLYSYACHEMIRNQIYIIVSQETQ